MADDTVRISELPGADALTGVELVPMVQAGTTKTKTVQDIVQEGGLAAHEVASDPHDQYAFRVINNLVATTNPTITSDSTEGYQVLSRWVNVSTGEIWLCLDASVGAAEWQIATLTVDDLGSAALANVGAGNGLDADLLDGEQGTHFLDFPNFTSVPSPVITLAGDSTGSATMTELGSITVNVVGVDSGRLGGETGAYYRNFTNLTNLPSPVVTVSGDATGSTTLTELGNGTINLSVQDSGNLQGQNGAYYRNFTNLTNLPSPTITASGDATGSTTLTQLGNGTINLTVQDSVRLGGETSSYYRNFTNLTDLPNPVVTLSGDVSGSATMTGLGDINITATVADDSHSHVIANVDGLATSIQTTADLAVSSHVALADPHTQYAKRPTRIAVIGDSLSTQQSVIEGSWPSIMKEYINNSGEGLVEVVNFSVNSLTYKKANDTIYFGLKTPRQALIDSEPDIVLCAFGVNDTLENSIGRSYGNIQNDVSSFHAALISSLPATTKIYQVRLDCRDTYAGPTNTAFLLNKHVIPFFMTRRTSGILGGAWCSEILGDFLSSTQRDKYTDTDNFYNYVGGFVDATIPIDYWRIARAGLLGVDQLHPSTTAKALMSSYVVKGLISNEAAPEFASLGGDKAYTVWFDAEDVLEGIMDKDNDYVPTPSIDATSHAVNLVNLYKEVSPESWYLPYKTSVSIPRSVITRDNIFTISFFNGPPNLAVLPSVNGGSFDGGNPAVVLPGSGSATVSLMNAISPTGTYTFRYRAGDEVYGPFSLVFLPEGTKTFSAMPKVGTDAIIASGSNADGYFVRYADGTQICTNQALVLGYSNPTRVQTNWSFPAPFNTSSVPIAAAHCVNLNNVFSQGYELNDVTGATQEPLTNSMMTFHQLFSSNQFVSGDTLITSVLAIGRWK